MKRISILGKQLCNSVALTGNDLTVIKGRIMEDLADGDAVVLDFPNNIADGKVGKNKNVIIAFNATGEQVTVTVRILKGSADDKFLNGELNSYRNSRPSYTLMTGEFVKRVGDGEGNITNEIYTVGAGFIQKYPSAKENVEGDTESAVSIYQIQYNNTDRSMG